MRLAIAFVAVFILVPATVSARITQRTVEIPTRPGVTQRFLVVSPERPKGVAIFFPGSHGGLRIRSDGTLGWGGDSFLVRARRLFAMSGITVAVLDAPSDRQLAPFLAGFRQTPEHVADVAAVIGWLRRESNLPVWLVGISRGTQSVAFVTVSLAGSGEGPDGAVLISTILTDDAGTAVPEMPLEKVTVPVVVVHHASDGCYLCRHDLLPGLMEKLSSVRRKELLMFSGGESRGEACHGLSYHGFYGIEPEVAAGIAHWMTGESEAVPSAEGGAPVPAPVVAPLPGEKCRLQLPAVTRESGVRECPGVAGTRLPRDRLRSRKFPP